MKGFWQLWSGGVPDDVVEDIKRIGELYPEQEATIGTDEKEVSKNSEIRRSKVHWLNIHDAQCQGIQNLCYDYFSHANRNCFGFELSKIYDIQYTKYHGEDKGFYKEHLDCFMGNSEVSHRKLSMTIQLSDSEEYEGGNFVFNDFMVHKHPLEEELRKKGTVLVFPSIFLHGVEPVTKGQRKSLVTWIEGPTWR